jgi:hypothetical protein
MKKLVILASVAAVAVAVPAQAHKGADGPGANGKGPGQGASANGPGQKGGHHGAKKAKRRCNVRYNAGGLFVDGSLTQTQGADTERRKDDRYSGSVTVDVKRGNRAAKADVGTTKTYTLTDVRVHFADTNGDGTADAPVAGDRVRVMGKVTRDNERCNPDDAATEPTIKKVGFGGPPPAQEVPTS